MFGNRFAVLYGIATYLFNIQTHFFSMVNTMYDIFDDLTCIHLLQHMLEPPEIIDDGEVDKKATDPKPLLVYTNSYIDKLSKCVSGTRTLTYEPNVSDWEHLTNSKLLEYTPLGNVLMYYSATTDSFVYYSDRAIPYDYIDTVARRYVLTYNCTQLYFDGTYLPLEEKSTELILAKDIPVKETELIVSKPNSTVFAKFKSYQNKKSDSNNTDAGRNINRYTYFGKLANCMFLKTNIITLKKKLTYAEFKKSQAFSKKLLFNN